MRWALLLTLLAPAAARAQPTVALRLAYAPALGEVARGMPMSDALSAHVPVQLDVLWRLGHPSAGAYASWGPGRIQGSACDAGASCQGSVRRAGVQGLWTFGGLGGTRLAPWAGLALGWEWASTRAERLGSRVSYGWSGPELALQGGAEWPLAGRFGLGPVLLVGLGRYARESLETSVGSGDADIGKRATHVWVHAGVRARVDF